MLVLTIDGPERVAAGDFPVAAELAARPGGVALGHRLGSRVDAVAPGLDAATDAQVFRGVAANPARGAVDVVDPGAGETRAVVEPRHAAVVGQLAAGCGIERSAVVDEAHAAGVEACTGHCANGAARTVDEAGNGAVEHCRCGARGLRFEQAVVGERGTAGHEQWVCGLPQDVAVVGEGQGRVELLRAAIDTAHRLAGRDLPGASKLGPGPGQRSGRVGHAARQARAGAGEHAAGKAQVVRREIAVERRRAADADHPGAGEFAAAVEGVVAAIEVDGADLRVPGSAVADESPVAHVRQDAGRLAEFAAVGEGRPGAVDSKGVVVVLRIPPAGVADRRAAAAEQRVAGPNDAGVVDEHVAGVELLDAAGVDEQPVGCVQRRWRGRSGDELAGGPDVVRPLHRCNGHHQLHAVERGVVDDIEAAVAKSAERDVGEGAAEVAHRVENRQHIACGQVAGGKAVQCQRAVQRRAAADVEQVVTGQRLQIHRETAARSLNEVAAERQRAQ